MNCNFETIRTEVETMDFIMHGFSKFGAEDTEPDSVYHSLLADAVNGAEVEVPRTASGWELYTMQDSNLAARAMASHTKYVVNLIQKHMGSNCDGDLEKCKLVEYLRGYCWRACIA